MSRLRHMVVDHHINDQNLRIEGNKVLGKQPIHDLVGSYHWVRLDDEHVFMIASYSLKHHHAIHNHDKVSVLPQPGSNKKLHKHLKDRHFNTLKKRFALDETHTSEDCIDAVSAEHGPLYGH